MSTKAEWIALGKQFILELLEEQAAAPGVELEARLCVRPWRDAPKAIDPHILTLARHELLEEGRIDVETATTRGGSKVAVFHLAPVVRGTKRKITDAAARKRLLVARWRSWARASQNSPNLIGEGGEAVVHKSLHKAAAHGYRLIQPSRGEVTSLFGKDVPGGPLDNGAWLLTVDARTQVPRAPIFVPIEVKNVRHWLYPNHAETYQLLHKAAGLANEHPEHPVLPVLICWRAHYRLRQLAADLGFLVFQTYSQYVLPSERIKPQYFEEVRTELGFEDLQITDSANPQLVDWLTDTVHREAVSKSRRWMEFGRHQIDIYAQLRRDSLSWPEQKDLVEELHKIARNNLPRVRKWAPSHDPLYEPEISMY